MSGAPEESLVEEPRLAGGRTLVRSFGTLAVGEIVARLAGLVALIVIARRLEPSGFGLIVLGTTLVNWFGTVGDSGTELITMRNVSRRPERFRSIVDHVLGLRLALSILASILLVVGVVLFIDDEAQRTVLLLFAPVLPILALNLRWIVLGVDAPRSVAIGNISSQVLFMVGVLLLVTGSDSTREVPVIRTVAELLYAVVVLGSLVRRFGIPVPRVNLRAWRRTLGESLPVLANNGARTLIYSFDLFLIAAILGSAQAGFYGAAYRPVLFVAGIAGLFSMAFLSAYSAARSQSRRHHLGSGAIRVGALVSLPIAAVTTVAASPLVSAVYGGAYAPAVPALAILGWTLPIMAMTIPYSTALIATDRQRTVMRHNVIGAALNVAANLLAVPLLGIEAAAAVTVASFAIVLALNHRSAVSLRLVPPIAETLRQWRRQVPAATPRSASHPER